MSYTNNLLFNNIFLQNLNPSEDELSAARYLVHESARDWYQDENFSSPQRIVANWIKPLLNQQSLDLVVSDIDDNAWYLVAPWEREAPLGLCYVLPRDESLNSSEQGGVIPKGKHWMIKAVQLARQQNELNLRWVILTNGVQWRLLDSTALRKYEAYLEIDLYRLLNGHDDPLAAYLFYRLFRFEGSFEQDEESGQNLLDNFLDQSEQATQSTEAYLKTMVSENLAIPGSGDGVMAQLCMGFVKALDPSGEKVFTATERDAIYHDATILLYRLLFILYAEARQLLPMDRKDYTSISLTQILDEAVQLKEQPDQNNINPSRLWEQLSTLFNAIHYSDEYLGIPPYNGGLFDDRNNYYLGNFLIEDEIMAEALFLLGFVRDDKGDKPPQKIDYCDLSVRHLGSLYEGMIEYKLFIAEEKLLARRDKKGKVQYLPASSNTQKPNDEVVQPGRVYFAQSPRERKATGTHYTAEPLVEKIVQQTVGRLLDHRWSEFQPQFQKMNSEIDAAIDDVSREGLQRRLDHELGTYIEKQVLSLKICDPAMGSGHFLVHIAHTLTNSILELLTKTPWVNLEVDLNPDYWRRLVVERCLYGVDISKMAVELAKLSLWLATMQSGRPLTFLDHHLKQGNSLLGVRLDEIVNVLSNDPLAQKTNKTRIAESMGQYRLQTPSAVMETIEIANQKMLSITQKVVTQIDDIQVQEKVHEEVRNSLRPYKRIGDLLVAQKMGWDIGDHDLRKIISVLDYQNRESFSENQNKKYTRADQLLKAQIPFHWDLEFPELFITENLDHKGFDVIIGNPPFLGGLKISGSLGSEILQFLKVKYSPSVGAADYCVYFFREGFFRINNLGVLGLVATNSIAQGDSRETGLLQIVSANGEIVFADRFVKWLGDASVEVNLLAIIKNRKKWNYLQKELDGLIVPNISSYLDDLPDEEPKPLTQNNGKSFQGDIPYGTGFIIHKKSAIQLIKKNTKNKEALFPYLTGQDVNTYPDHKSRRYTICFHDWSLERARQFADLFDIVKKYVKPQREKVNRKRNRENWWLFGEYRKGLREAIQNLDRVLVRSIVSEINMFAFVSGNQVLSCKLAVFAFDSYFYFAILQSSIHDTWLRRNATTLRTDISYSISNCFDTFPFPQNIFEQTHQLVDRLGKEFYEHRQKIMFKAQLGLTKTYNLFHDNECLDDEMIIMRQMNVEMDQLVLISYGWEDIDLDYNFYLNDRGKIRFMPSRDAQREIYTRLITLNHEIAADETSQNDR